MERIKITDETLNKIGYSKPEFSRFYCLNNSCSEVEIFEYKGQYELRIGNDLHVLRTVEYIDQIQNLHLALYDEELNYKI